MPSKLLVRRLYRPEEVSQELAYRSGWWDVYAGPLPPLPGAASTSTAAAKPPTDLVVDVDKVVAKAAARLPQGKTPLGGRPRTRSWVVLHSLRRGCFTDARRRHARASGARSLCGAFAARRHWHGAGHVLRGGHL